MRFCRVYLPFFCALLFLAVAQRPALAFQSYFINQEVKSDNIQMFPKWTGMLQRYNAEAKTLDSICGEETYSPCRLKTWKDFLISQQDKPLADQVREINAFINKTPYIEDIVNWGISDYWETPYEFQRKNGDCEDFAIAKFISLRAIGVPDQLMRVTIVRDLNLGDIIHAILVVKVDDQSLIMDNQIKQVVPAMKVYHYIPVYAINETHWWQYFVTP